MKMAAQEKTPKPAGTMKTIDKSLWLLSFFTPETPELRLSELARAAGIDKVTTMRVMASLAQGGLIERHPETKKYRLGAGFLRFARIREATFPVITLLQPILDALAQTTGETSHACLVSGNSLTTVAVGDSQRAIRVFVDPVQTLPVHATASGLVFLAFSDGPRADAILAKTKTTRFTQHTETDLDGLQHTLAKVRADGFAVSARTFESDVTGIAAPVFDWHGKVFATVATACMASRLTPELQDRIAAEVIRAAARATAALGGEQPDGFGPPA
jgi:IclR family acetate operon transcriptional repressor